MAEVFLRRRLEEIGVDARVHSAGLLDDGWPAPREAVSVARAMGYDTSRHRSTKLTEALVSQADLVLCMAREHLRHAVVLVPAAWPRTFTLKELVRRAEEVGPRPPGQPFDEWLAKIHAGRDRGELLGSSREDDVADPIGLGEDAYRRTGEELDRLVTRLVALGWGGE